MSIPIPISIIDAFTSVPFRGNPAAVCLLDEVRDEQWMQDVAAEMNLSETAFLHRREDGSYDLRWFTPTVEVDLCGHATLASAHFLWENQHAALDSIASFHTRSGLLTAERTEEGIRLNLPSEPAQPMKAPEELIQGLGLIPRYVGKNRMDYLVEVDSVQTVQTLKPDYAMLAKVEARGVIVTSKGTGKPGDYDFVSRCFYPASGCDEDPVTGSAHCALAPYWQRRLRQTSFMAYQASPRGGELFIELRNDRVLLSGQAVTVVQGQLTGK
ncbi:PhzF family phenazine biosynthesis protein [Paenibacillus sp. BC26]|uniref:PhzF family phenazine biosynthesis protein n=1 Tax=Paenibacillus sp. BC26 TaxID=1881032 RepID=UPI0008E8F192|nr:PhzF family phenazine biosynthesis protein [Paenibacillus sp. BC26]SFS60070.1 phenazine biosynthesis protein PhzF family [Paenibacillus sp. BC26]